MKYIFILGNILHFMCDNIPILLDVNILNSNFNVEKVCSKFSFLVKASSVTDCSRNVDFIRHTTKTGF